MWDEFNNRLSKFDDTYYQGSVGKFDVALYYPLKRGGFLEIARTDYDQVVIYEKGHEDAIKEFADEYEIDKLVYAD